MFILTAQATILGIGGPAVRIHLHFPRSSCNHWFNGNRHAFFYAQSSTSFPILWYSRFFMHRRRNAVSNEVSYVIIAFWFSIRLNRMTDVADAITNLSLFDS